jgi:hypothetical protein
MLSNDSGMCFIGCVGVLTPFESHPKISDSGATYYRSIFDATACGLNSSEWRAEAPKGFTYEGMRHLFAPFEVVLNLTVR